MSLVWNFIMPEQSNGVTFALIVPLFMLILSMLYSAQIFNTSVFKYIITAVRCSRTKHFNIQWKRRQFWLAVFIAYNCSWSFVSLSSLLFLYVLALHMKTISIWYLMFDFILIFSGKFCHTTIIETNRYILDTSDDDRSHLPIKDPKRFEGRTIDDWSI